jgi:hypothetical protein
MNRINKRFRNHNESSQRIRLMSEDLTKKGNANYSLSIINNSNENDNENINKLSIHKSNSHKGFFLTESFTDKENLLKNSEFSPIENKNSTKPDSIGLDNTNYSNHETFLNQNLIDYEEVLKLIVIGDKAVGKTLLVNRFVSDKLVDLYESKGYIPTEW